MDAFPTLIPLLVLIANCAPSVRSEFQCDTLPVPGGSSDSSYEITLVNCEENLATFNSATIWVLWASVGDSRFSCTQNNLLVSSDCAASVTHLNILNTAGDFQPRFVCTAIGTLATMDCSTDIPILNGYIGIFPTTVTDQHTDSTILTTQVPRLTPSPPPSTTLTTATTSTIDSITTTTNKVEQDANFRDTDTEYITQDLGRVGKSSAKKSKDARGHVSHGMSMSTLNSAAGRKASIATVSKSLKGKSSARLSPSKSVMENGADRYFSASGGDALAKNTDLMQHAASSSKEAGKRQKQAKSMDSKQKGTNVSFGAQVTSGRNQHFQNIGSATNSRRSFNTVIVAAGIFTGIAISVMIIRQAHGRGTSRVSHQEELSAPEIESVGVELRVRNYVMISE